MSKKMPRLKICPNDSPAFQHWWEWLDEKGFKSELQDGYLFRVFSYAEFTAYLRDSAPHPDESLAPASVRAIALPTLGVFHGNRNGDKRDNRDSAG